MAADQQVLGTAPGSARSAGWRSASAAALLFLSLLLAGLWNLEGPEPWWDEGWTLSVARNLAERGMYARLLDGQLIASGLEASPYLTGVIGLVFHSLGVGLWQGRLLGVTAAAAAITCAWWIATALYNERVAVGTVIALLLLTMHPQLNGMLIGRQVLGEMPMLACLLAGYAYLILGVTRSPLWCIPTALLWGIANALKLQTLAFLAPALAVTLVVALTLRSWRVALTIAGIALGERVIVAPLLQWLSGAILASRMLPVTAVNGLQDVMAVVPQASNRLYALTMLLLFGLPTLFGLAYSAWRLWRDRLNYVSDPRSAVRLCLLALAGGWTAWYALLSVGAPRYFFPAAFIGAIFVGSLLYDLTGGLDLRATLARLVEPLRARRLTRAAGAAWLATLILAAAVPLTLLSYQRYYLQDERAAERVAAYLNTQTPDDTLVETYEAELHFFLNRPYHYPPDQLHVALNRRSLLGQPTPVEYDPLADDPDYLVVGRFARGNDLYAPVIASGAFQLVLHDGEYEVYRRVR